MIKLQRHDTSIRRFDIVQVDEEGVIYVRPMQTAVGEERQGPPDPKPLDEVVREGFDYYINEDFTKVLEMASSEGEVRAA